MMEIVAGMGNSAVNRMKKTWHVCKIKIFRIFRVKRMLDHKFRKYMRMPEI
jgi:hypothetical protein